MSLNRFFIDKSNLIDIIVTIDGEENQHLFSVLRLRVGEKIMVCFNDGIEHLCELIKLDKKSSQAKILQSTEQKVRAKITLFMALIKAERMDWAVQKVTELGVSEIVPFESENCTVKDKGNKLDRLYRIALSASKQSGRVKLPKIYNTMNFDEVLNKLDDFSQIIVAYENETSNAKTALKDLDVTKSIALIIGSEGGFTVAEIEKLKNKNAKIISLGETILRAETASVALLSALNYELGLWEKNK